MGQKLRGTWNEHLARMLWNAGKPEDKRVDNLKDEESPRFEHHIKYIIKLKKQALSL